jgi:hypothetical protein
MVFLSHRNFCNRPLETLLSLSRDAATLQPSATTVFRVGNIRGSSVLSKHPGCRLSGIAAQQAARLIVTDSSLGLGEVSAIIPSPGRRQCLHGTSTRKMKMFLKQPAAAFFN